MSIDQAGAPAADHRASSWTFLTNHGHVLLALCEDPQLRQRDIARIVGITEGAVHRILGDLEADGYVEVQRTGRRNSYAVKGTPDLRHPLEDPRRIEHLGSIVVNP